MEMAAAPSLPQAPKLGDFADQYPPEAGAGLAVGASLASLMPSISSHGEDYSAAARSGQPTTPGRGTSASALSPRTKGYAGGVTKSGKRRRRHPVAEIKGGWTLEEDARLKQCADKPTLTSFTCAGLCRVLHDLPHDHIWTKSRNMFCSAGAGVCMLKPSKPVQAWESLLRICASISLNFSLGVSIPAFMLRSISQYDHMHIGRLMQPISMLCIPPGWHACIAGRASPACCKHSMNCRPILLIPLQRHVPLASVPL